MTDEQKYNELLKELGELIKHKNEEIVYLHFKNDDLKRALQKAEEQLEAVEQKNDVIELKKQG